MGLFVFAMILLLIGVGVLLFGDLKSEGINLRLWGLIPLFISLFMVFGSMYSPVGAREVGIPETFGHLGTDMQPGAHFIAPWTTVHKCSLAQQQSILTQAPSEGDKAGGDGVLVNGNDQGQGLADVFVTYHFDALTAHDLYQKYGCDEDRIKQNLIRPATKNVVPAIAANYPSLDIKAKRAEISEAAVPAMTKIVDKDGIKIDNVLISELTLSKPTQDAADAKLAAQQAAQQAEFARQKAETDLKTAQIKASADQQANDVKNKSLSPAILCSNWIDMLAQVKPSTLLVNGPCSTDLTNPNGLFLTLPGK